MKDLAPPTSSSTKESGGCSNFDAVVLVMSGLFGSPVDPSIRPACLERSEDTEELDDASEASARLGTESPLLPAGTVTACKRIPDSGTISSASVIRRLTADAVG